MAEESLECPWHGPLTGFCEACELAQRAACDRWEMTYRAVLGSLLQSYGHDLAKGLALARAAADEAARSYLDSFLADGTSVPVVIRMVGRHYPKE